MSNKSMFTNKFKNCSEITKVINSLLESEDCLSQRNKIIKFFESYFSAHVSFWFIKGSYPLPGQPTSYILEEVDSDINNLPITRAKQANNNSLVSHLNVRGQKLAVIKLEREIPFLENDIHSINNIINMCALALQISRQTVIKNYRTEQLKLVSEISNQIANMADFNKLANEVTDLIQKTFNLYYVAIFTLNPKENLLKLISSSSKNKDQNLPGHVEIPFGVGMIGTVAQSGKEILAEDVRFEPTFKSIQTLPDTLSEISLPLRVQNTILGVLDIQSDKEEGLNNVDLVPFRALADNIAIAFERTHIFEDLILQTKQLQSIHEITHVISSILDIDSLLKKAISLIQEKFGYPVVRLYTLQAYRHRVVYRTGSGLKSKLAKQSQETFELSDSKGIISHVARTGKTLLANDISKEPLYKPSPLLPQITRSELAVPLNFSEETLGVLDIQSDEIDSFLPSDVTLMEALCSSIAISLRNANLYRSEQWRRQIAESFQEVVSQLTTNIAVNDLLNTILSKLKDILPCDAAAIWLFREPSSRNYNSLNEMRVASSLAVDKQALEFSLHESEFIRNWLLSAAFSKEPVLRKSSDPKGPLGEVCGFLKDYSSIAAPLIAGDEIFGVLTLAHHAKGKYGSEAVSLISTFASYSAAAIQNARLFSHAQEQALISTILLQVAEAARLETNLDELLTTLARIIPLLTGVNGCILFLKNDDDKTYILKSSFGALIPALTPMIFSGDLPGFKKISTDNLLQAIPDLELDLGLPEETFPEAHSKNYLVPLVSHNGIIGALLVSRSMNQSIYNFQEQDTQFLPLIQGIALQSAVAIENLRFNEIHQEDAYVTAVLLQVAEAIVSPMNLDETLETIVHLLPILAGIDACEIYSINESKKEYELTSTTISKKGICFPFGSASLLDLIVTTNAQLRIPLGINSCSQNWPALSFSETSTNNVDEQPSSWLLGFPISSAGEIFGVLLCSEQDVPQRFQGKRMEMLYGVAQQIALAFQNHRSQLEKANQERLFREIQVARQIQQTFLPEKLPALPGWQLEVRWKTARQVGGDFYDVINCGKDWLGLVIADVSDKGIAAALYMTVTRTLIRSFAQSSRSPAHILQKVNSLLNKESQDGMFVTAAYILLNLHTGESLYTHAGQNLPFYYNSTEKKLSQLPGGGIGLGVLPSIRLVDYSFQFNPGDMVIMYTDGITDTLSPKGKEFGEKRFSSLIRRFSIGGITTTLRRIDAELEAFHGDYPLDDDLTILAIQRNKND